MVTLHFPVLVWPDAAGGSTAALVGDADEASAYASTSAEALQSLKELLEWRLENEPWNVDVDFREPQLVEFKIEVRPQFREENRIIPCPETLWLRVPCVLGIQENGLRACAVPHLGLRFTYQDSHGLKELVNHFVKEALQGLSPLQLAGCLPPQHFHLENITLRHNWKDLRVPPPHARPELQFLFAVADPLLHDSGRKQAMPAAYGREALAAVLVKKLTVEKVNVLLVGESGVGKSILLLEAVKRLTRLQDPKSHRAEEEADTDLNSYRFWRGNGGRLMAGMRYLGEWEERCEEFIQQLNRVDGVLCAESLLELLQAGGQGPSEGVAAFLLPYLQRGELRMVAEATPAEVEACRRLLPGLLDVFQMLPVPAFTDGEAVEVLQKIGHTVAAGARISVEPGVALHIHRLFKRFQPYAAFPGPAAQFLRRLCEKAGQSPPGRPLSLSPGDVVRQFIVQTGLPEIFLRDELVMHRDDVLRHFESQIIGQPEAARMAARLVTTIKSGLTDPARPYGVYLFCGPTGVGKTALAKLLADYCFGAGNQKDRLIRLDMSEYSGWDAGRRLLYSSQHQAAPWIERVRRQPFCVLLLDEIEKAAAEVFDALLGLLDEGRLTDCLGRVTSFRSAIIILTSNLGSNLLTTAGFHGDAAPSYESSVVKFFRPEFFNRLDGVITFKSLDPGDVEKIARKELSELAAREGLASANLRLAWSDRLVSTLAREGYDHQLGARPLQRTLENRVVAPLARWRVAHPGVSHATLNIDLGPDQGLAITVSSDPA